MTQTRTVICMKWGTLYPAVYVNVLYRAVRANLTGPFRFVCLTDDATGLDPEIESFPIPDMGLDDSQWKKGGWAKLGVFGKELYDIEGRCLFVDLDSVIAGPIDDLFTHPGEVVVLDVGPNWKAGKQVTKPEAGTCYFAFTAGEHPELLGNFLADPKGMVAKYRIEQAYVQGELPQDALAFWPAAWAPSFKYHLRQPLGLNLFKPPHPPSADTRIIAFHGEPRPIDLIRSGWWGIAPHVGRGRVPWMMEYWARHGGDVARD